MKKIFSVVIAVLLVASFTVFAAGTTKKKELQILMAIPRASNPFHGRCAEKVIDEAKKIGGVKIIVSDAQDDVQKQISDIEAAIAKGIDGIITAPCDDVGAIPAVEAAWNAKVPLVTYDRTVQSDKILAHVGHDNLDGGKMLGEWMRNAIGGKGTVVVLTAFSGSAVTNDRDGGFRMQLRQSPNTIIIDYDAFNRRDLAKAAMENILTANPKIDGVYSHNEDMLLGAIPVLEERGIRPKLCSYDTHVENLKLIYEGRMDAVLEQFPDEQVRTALRVLVSYIRDGTQPQQKYIYLKGKLITKANLEQSEKWDEAKKLLE